jgi:formylglycine-generating enzyme required for sulfatase activity
MLVLYRCFSLQLILVFFILPVVACTNLPDQNIELSDQNTDQLAQIIDDFGLPMALVPAGDFKIAGWDGERGEPSVSTYVDNFYIDIYEVTNRRYAECVGDSVCALPKITTSYTNEKFLDHPVVFVTWDMAQTYCQWRGARLPSKAEWEKGASDELAMVEYYWGDESPVCQVGSRLGAEIDENADYATGTEAVGSHAPNIFGLYDMTGNVWEWVQDPYVGGAYRNSPSFVSFLRMASWSGYGPVYKRFLCGFRCARSP